MGRKGKLDGFNPLHDLKDFGDFSDVYLIGGLRMERDIGDILDRWSISKLKAERIGTDENKREYEAFTKAIDDIKKEFTDIDWDSLCELMVNVNDCIWQCEAGLKGGKEELTDPFYILSDQNKNALANIGAMTIVIRNFNNLRVKFKNIVNKMTNTGFQDAKSNHLSE
jgi:hypothetical protein